jgi:hypothetical protein
MNNIQLRWRKFTPIDRDFPIFELLDGDIIILDVAKGDSGAFEIAFHGGASGRVFDLGMIERMIEEVKVLLEMEAQ